MKRHRATQEDQGRAPQYLRNRAGSARPGDAWHRVPALRETAGRAVCRPGLQGSHSQPAATQLAVPADVTPVRLWYPVEQIPMRRGPEAAPPSYSTQDPEIGLSGRQAPSLYPQNLSGVTDR